MNVKFPPNSPFFFKSGILPLERSGGFYQPIPGVPSTLTALVQRDSLLSLSWLPAALSRKGFQYECISSDKTALRKTAEIWIAFVLLRLGGEIALTFTTDYSIDTLEAVRQCWFVALFVGAFRYIYGQYNR